jgi:hypothetical protein
MNELDRLKEIETKYNEFLNRINIRCTEFKGTGLLWWINMILHTFGWAIFIEIDKETKKITSMYPKRCKFRGFSENDNDEGYIKVSEYLKMNIDDIEKEAKE